MSQIKTIEEHRNHLYVILRQYLPAKAVAYCVELIITYKLHLHIEVARKDRLGDYHPHLGKGNRISINHNLNQFDFLITFIHELAHHTTFKKYGPHHQSHGDEWKEEFRIHMRPIVMHHFFPPDIEAPLIRHMKRPHYTHTGDIALVKALRKYDPRTAGYLLDELAMGAVFKTSSKARIILIKGDKRRTYYHCKAKDSSKSYLVHGAAEVFLV